MMQRRKFILLFTSVIVSAFAVYWWFSDNAFGFKNSPAFPTYLNMIMNARLVREIGEFYLRRFPEERDENTLLSLLSPDNDAGHWDASHLEKRIHMEYRQGNTIIVRGWVLSKSEARQCALYSIYTS